MSLAAILLIIPVILISTAKALSFAVWNWKHDNKTGAAFIIAVCLASLALPVYAVFHKS